MAKTTKRKLYLVYRNAWHSWEYSLFEHENDYGVPIRAFPTEARAKEYCKEQDRKARAMLNPFQFGEEIEYLFDLEDEELCEEVEKLGLTPPPAKKVTRYGREQDEYDWLQWWTDHIESMTEEQRLAIWDKTQLVLFHVRSLGWDG